MDAEIAAIARSQYGVVSLAQLCKIGLSPRTISDRVAAGRLHRIHPGVFAVGHAALTREALGWPQSSGPATER